MRGQTDMRGTQTGPGWPPATAVPSGESGSSTAAAAVVAGDTGGSGTDAWGSQTRGAGGAGRPTPGATPLYHVLPAATGLVGLILCAGCALVTACLPLAPALLQTALPYRAPLLAVAGACGLTGVCAAVVGCALGRPPTERAMWGVYLCMVVAGWGLACTWMA